MSACRNPECRDKYTPGIIASGRGSPRAPVVGATMRWGWVNCRACNPKDKDPPYSHTSRSSAEIQERARLADSKAPYVHQEIARNPNLQAIKASTNSSAVAHAQPADARMDRMLDKIEKLTDQVTSLLEENRALRAKLETNSHTDAVVKRPRKKRGTNDVKTSPKNKWSLS